MKRILFLAFGLMVSAALAQGDLSSAQQPTPAPAPAGDMTTTAPTPAAPTEASPADQANAEMDGLGDWLDDAGAMERMLELMQQGKYVRKSLTVVPMLFWMGSGLDDVRRRHRPLVLASLRDSLKHMSRFDINPVSQRAMANFRSAWDAEWYNTSLKNMFNPAKREATLARLIDEKLVPDLFGAMMGVMKERAEKNLTEDQVNSFMVDKAKESGVTATELNLVLNAGYVVIPVVEYLAYGIDSKGGYQATIRGGLYLYKVNVGKDKISLEKKASLIRVGQELVDKDGYSLLDRALLGKLAAMPTSEIIMHKAIDNMMTAVMQDMRDMPEFRLLSQMTFAEKSTYQIPFGPGEIKDVGMDKFFEQVEQVQAKDGSIKDEVTGWGFVNKPINFKYPVKKTDSNTTEYIWQGYAAKGEIMSGVVTREYSRVPVDVDFRVGAGMLGIEVPEDGMLGLVVAPKKAGEKFTISGVGLMAQFQTMYSPLLGVSGLGLHINATYKYVPIAEGELYAPVFSPLGTNYQYTSMASYDAGIGVHKKWWFGQIVPMVGADIRFGRFGLFAEDSLGWYEDYGLVDYYIGARASAGVEYAFTPNVRAGINAAGLWNSNFGNWEIDGDLGDDEEDTGDAIDADDPIKMSMIGFEAGAHIMVNAWPLRKAYDKVLTMTTSGGLGALRQGSLTPLP